MDTLFNEINDHYTEDFVQSIRTTAVLRSANPNAFTPLTIAIGPIHHHLCNMDNTIGSFLNNITSSSSLFNSLHNFHNHHSFAEMERHKEVAVMQIMGTSVSNPSCREDYAGIVSSRGIFMTINGAVEPPEMTRIRRFYSFRDDVQLESLVDVIDVPNPNPEASATAATTSAAMDLQSVLIRDSCFIVEILKCLCKLDGKKESEAGASEHRTAFCKRFGAMGLPTKKALLLDILLLENQIPLFLIQRVMACNGAPAIEADNHTPSLCTMVKAIARKTLPFCKDAVSKINDTVLESEHLLDCIYKIVTGTDQNAPDHTVDISFDSDDAGEITVRASTWGCFRRRHRNVNTSDRNMPTATELQMAGIKFRGRHDGSLRDVSFDRHTLVLPVVRVDGDSERILLNLLAHETRGKGVVVLSYLHFMNSLINTAQDVDVLVKAGVLSESMGDHQSVAQMWNRLTVNTPRKYTEKYKDIVRQAHHYVDSSVHVFMYEFQQEYLSRPWLVVSLLSGTALLVMTFVIMYYTILLYEFDTSAH